MTWETMLYELKRIHSYLSSIPDWVPGIEVATTRVQELIDSLTVHPGCPICRGLGYITDTDGSSLKRVPCYCQELPELDEEPNSGGHWTPVVGRGVNDTEEVYHEE